MTEIRDATWDDFDAVFELLSARSRAAFGISQLQPASLRQRWELPGGARWVATADGTIAGFATLEEEGTMTAAAVDPAVADALLARVEDTARARGLTRLVASAVREDEPLWALLERSGFEQDREVLRMWRPLTPDEAEPTWASGMRVRTYADADAPSVQALLDEAYGGWDPNYVPLSHDGWLAFMTQHDEFDPALWFLVEREGELVACALHWKEHQGRGWVKDIVVRESERGQGLARRLLHTGFHAYAQRGADRVGLKVDSTNPSGAIQLYEREGFAIDQRLALWRKEL